MKRIIQTDDAPEAIGPYSQAVMQNGWVWCSGQIPIDPSTGEMEGPDVSAQTRRVMQNLGHVLRAAGTDFGKVVKCTIFLTDMEDFAAVNKVYGTYFESDPPARETVEVRKLPRGAKVEISCIASVG